MSLVEKELQSPFRPRIGSETAHREAVRRAEFSLPHGFEALELAGMGAFSEVWKVLEISTGRTCALKRLRPERCDEATARQLIKNEAQASQAVSSSHVLKLLKGEPLAEIPYLVFEWVTGRTLEDELSDGALSLRRAVWIARQCADGMQDLERVGLAHGDIKPQNVFVTFGGEVKLLDLGFVRPINVSPNGPTAEWAGTPEYTPPESLSREFAHPITKDLYSLGVMLYRMITGRLPFVGDTASIVLVHQRQTKPTLLRHYRPDAPRELSDLLGRMLAKQPLRRPQGLQGLIRELVDLELLFLSSELAEGA